MAAGKKDDGGGTSSLCRPVPQVQVRAAARRDSGRWGGICARELTSTLQCHGLRPAQVLFWPGVFEICMALSVGSFLGARVWIHFHIRCGTNESTSSLPQALVKSCRLPAHALESCKGLDWFVLCRFHLPCLHNPSGAVSRFPEYLS